MALLDAQFYHPTRARYADPAECGLTCEPVTFTAADGVPLHAWWFAAEGPARGSVVHCHGNAGNISAHFGNAAWLAASGFHVLCFDYRGYGRSGGRPHRGGTILDAHAAIDHARGRPEVDPRGVLLFGQSLGGAVALVAAAGRSDLAGVAVDGAFSSYRQEALWACRQAWWTRGLARWIARWGISAGDDPIDLVGRISPTPLFLMHGMHDRVVPWEMSRDLYRRAGPPKDLWLIPELGHNQALHLLAEQARPRLVGFFETCAGVAGAGGA